MRTSLAHGITLPRGPRPTSPAGMGQMGCPGHRRPVKSAKLELQSCPLKLADAMLRLGMGELVWGLLEARVTQGPWGQPGLPPAQTHLRSGRSRPHHRRSGCPLQCGGRLGRRRGPPPRRDNMVSGDGRPKCRLVSVRPLGCGSWRRALPGLRVLCFSPGVTRPAPGPSGLRSCSLKACLMGLTLCFQAPRARPRRPRPAA